MLLAEAPRQHVAFEFLGVFLLVPFQHGHPGAELEKGDSGSVKVGLVYIAFLSKLL